MQYSEEDINRWLARTNSTVYMGDPPFGCSVWVEGLVQYLRNRLAEEQAANSIADMAIERLTAERDEARRHAEWQRDRWQEHIGRFDITSRNQPFPWEEQS